MKQEGNDPMPDYVIVGAEVGSAPNALSDGTVVPANTPGAIPLDVEFIGRLLVELSTRGPGGVSPQQLADFESQVKAALVVGDLDEAGQAAPLTDAAKAKILQETTVRIEFEERRPGNPDVNTRILVVPSDGTLQIAEAGLQQDATTPGFAPPLSYPIDHALMISHLKAQLMDLADSFSPPGVTEAIRQALRRHITQWIEDSVTIKDAVGHVIADDPRNMILSDPVRSFHRSVGIYATNMCR